MIFRPELSPQVASIMARHEALQRAREEAVYRAEQAARRAVLEAPKPPRVPGLSVRRNRGIEIISVPRRGARMIHGVAATETTTSNGNSYSMMGCKVSMPVPLLSAHHEHGKIGEVVLVRKESTRIYIQAVLDDHRGGDYAWSMIQDGTLRGLSVGTAPKNQCVVEGVRFYDQWQLREVSLVKAAANPDCLFEVLR